MAEWFVEQADRFARATEAATPEARQALYDAIGLCAYWTPGVDAVEVTIPPTIASSRDGAPGAPPPGDRGGNGVSEGRVALSPVIRAVLPLVA